MELPDYIPNDYERIQVVDDLTALFNASFGPANVILCPRKLTGDFNALACSLLDPKKNFSPDMVELKERLEQFAGGTDEVAQAAQTVLSDMKLMEQAGATPDLRVLGFKNKSYNDGHYFFHHDEYGTDVTKTRRGVLMCCYNGPMTEGIRNEDVNFKIHKMFYIEKEGAKILRFAPGDFWRHASSVVDGQPDVPPYIHRAPVEGQDGPRLFLTGF